jgi:hypothetical protein
MLDGLCAEIGRDPIAITRSTSVRVSYDDPAITRSAIAKAVDAGFSHIVLGLSAPYPDRIAPWLVDP